MGLTKLVLRFFHNMADLTLVTSPQLKEEMEQWGIKRIAVWRKGIDTQVPPTTHHQPASQLAGRELGMGVVADGLSVYRGGVW